MEGERSQDTGAETDPRRTDLQAVGKPAGAAHEIHQSGRESEGTGPHGAAPDPAGNGSAGAHGRALWPYLAVGLLALLGLGLSAELLRLHVQANLHPEAGSFCSINARLDCLNVAESRYAVFAGAPVAAWSLLGQLLLLALALRAAWRPRRPGPTVLTAGATLAVLVSALMTGLSHFVLHSLCLFCLGLGAVNLVLAGLVWYGLGRLARRQGIRLWELALREVRGGLRSPFLWSLAGFGLVAAVGLGLFYPKYWKESLPGGPAGLAHGRDASGHYWIGAKHPRLVLQEFTDFQCPFCRKGHRIARQAVARLKDQVRLVHYDFPLDEHCNHNVTRPFHPASCRLAAAARCAGEQGKFWEMSDALFARQARRGGADPYILARKLGLDMEAFRKCLKAPRTRRAIQADIRAGDRLRVRGTPTFFVNGRRLRRWPKAEVLARLLRERSEAEGGFHAR